MKLDTPLKKNLAFAAGTFALATAGPVGPLSVVGLIAQPALAATKWTKGNGRTSKIGQAALGGLLSFFAIGFGAVINPTTGNDVQVAKNATPAVEEVVEAPAPAPAPVIKRDYEFPTHAAAEKEMCDAGKQYLGDVLAGRMSPKAGKQEVRGYAAYLSKNSPASAPTLVTIGMACSGLTKF